MFLRLAPERLIVVTPAAAEGLVGLRPLPHPTATAATTMMETNDATELFMV